MLISNQAKIGLAMLLKKYKFEPCSKSKDKFVTANNLVVLQPKDGVYLRVERIK